MFTVNHALSCKKGGFIAQRHDTIRDLLTSRISKVCRDVETEPFRHPLDNEVFNLQSTVVSREARLDMKAGGFWITGVTAFFDVRVTHVFFFFFFFFLIFLILHTMYNNNITYATNTSYNTTKYYLQYLQLLVILT